MSGELPLCFNFRKGTCERSDMVIAAEQDTCWVLHCRTCKSIQVSSKPDEMARARYQVQLERYERRKQMERARERRTVIG